MAKKYWDKNKKGFSLIEIIVSLGIFLVISLAVWQSFSYISELINTSRIKVAAMTLANEQMELIRNLPCDDVGVVGYIPSGKLARTKEVIKNNVHFIVNFTVMNVDDPFDGIAGGDPTDLSPADYKLVEIKINCSTCKRFPPLYFTTTVAPKNLESASTNGSLFIRAIDANGQSIAQANVSVINNQVSPTINMTETTNNSGWLQLIGVPPSFESYQIIVSKNGYSTDQTYLPGDPVNPNPIKPHATVVAQEVTQITFVIDKVSTINVFSMDQSCNPVGNISFSLKGSKLIGLNPDIYKYNENLQTNSSGEKNINNLEWDNYSIAITSSNYALAGSMPLSPFNLAPDSMLDLFLIVRQVQPKAILVKVKDASNGLPVSGANVTIQKPGWTQSLLTGRGYLRQISWKGGSGQENFIIENKYWEQDYNINNSDQLTLIKTGNNYQSNGWLISSTFDTGAISNFYTLDWLPQDQPQQTEVKFQIASSLTNPPESWNFIGPDGTANSYYTLSNNNIYAGHNNDRYLRYKVFLSTQNQSVTPSIASIVSIFSSGCLPSGQAFFYNLPAANIWTLTVSKEGYETYQESNIDISKDWQEKEVFLIPSS